jgi:uncharacterized protein (TIGR04222 family)
MTELTLGTDEQRALWRRIAAHPLLHAARGFDFTTRLARENGWSRRHAGAVVEEYRRYCFLACVAGRCMSPSDAVDQAWHLHLTYSRDYWDVFCRDVLRAPLHHEPTRGGAGELARHRAQYADTLAEYERWFGAPPEALWPSTHEQFRAPARWRRVDLERVAVWPRPRVRLRFRRALATLAALLAAPAAHALSLNPLDWSGGAFLALYAFLLLAALPTTLVVRWILRSGSMRPGPALGPYELAYLGGGTARVADTAVAELFAKGAARMDGDAVRLERAPADNAYVATAARVAAQKPSDRALVAAFEPMVVPLKQNLERRGLLLDEAATRRVRLWSAAVPGALVALGVAKIAIGMSRDRPVAFLVVLTAIAAVFLLAMLLRNPGRTTAGDSVLANAKREHARAARAPRDLELPLAVALLGTTALAGTAYAGWHAHRVPQQTGDAGTSGDGGSSLSSSDSSSDSGGDSGSGGGCGGCGGGGGD